MEVNNSIKLSLRLYTNHKDEIEVCSENDIEKILEWKFCIYIVFSKSGCDKIQKIAKENIGKKLSLYANNELIFDNYEIFPPSFEEMFGTITPESKYMCINFLGSSEKREYIKKHRILTINENTIKNKIIITKDTKAENYETHLQTIVYFCVLLINNDKEYRQMLYKNEWNDNSLVEDDFERLFNEGIKIKRVEIIAIYQGYNNDVFWIEMNFECISEDEIKEMFYILTVEKINGKYVIYF
jgi:hypothetical protein